MNDLSKTPEDDSTNDAAADRAAEDFIQSLIPAIEEQLLAPETSFVQANLLRLSMKGHDEDEIKKMMALCLADESNQMFVEEREFDLKRYAKLLELLPELPGEEDIQEED